MDFSGLIAESLLRSRSEAIIAADREGVIRFWNPGAERIFGHAAADAIGRSLDIIIPERLRNRHWDGYRRTIATGRSRYGEGDVLSVPAQHKSGATISIEFTVLPLRDSSDAIVAIVAIMRDVTTRFEEIRQLKRQLAESSASGTAKAPS
ncbi:MAG: PAS domain-containing protein [Xanthobacteraceae bacterium]|jgi:PAS domain S-box-containing protein